MSSFQGTLPSSVVKNVSRMGGDGLPTNSSRVICYESTMISAAGVWAGMNPFDYALPLFFAQIILVVITTRILVVILKPFRQPRVVSEIIGGIILGPSVIGRVKDFGDTVFPARSLLTLETMAYLGLLFFLFLIGVEMDILVIKKMGRKAVGIALAGMALPFCIGTATSFVFREQMSKNVYKTSFLLFLGVALSVTAFPVLARILAEIKLLNTELGRIAMSSAIINDVCAWILLAIAIAISEADGTILSALWVVLCTFGFMVFCIVAIRPVMRWMIRRIPEGDGVSNFQVCLILTGVMLSGLATDAIGLNAVFGGFMFGLVIPNGALGEALIEKLEGVVNGLLLPLFFVISGLRTDLSKVKDSTIVWPLVLVFVLASIGKVAGTLLIAMFYTMPFREGLALGFLMNTRGLVEMIILNIGRDKEVLDDESFAVLVLMSVIMTSIVTPVVTRIHRPARRLLGYKRRNLQRWKPDTELRMLTCIQNPRNVPTIIGLLEISNPTKRSPIFLYVLHLIEINGRASAVLAAAHTSGTKTGSGLSLGGKAENIFSAFDNYEQHAGGVSISAATAISPYATMHEDACNLAEDKHVTIIVLPFHKHMTVDGGLEAANPAMRNVNKNILANAPCSVGILVDRGLGSAARTAAARGQYFSHNVGVLFFGGPDDREALAYAWRMAEHPGVCLEVVRFLPPSTSCPQVPAAATVTHARGVTIMTSEEREREMDDEYFTEFRLKNVNNESVVYTEKAVANSEETVAAIRGMDSVYDLLVVGRGQGEGAMAQLTAGMTDFSEYAELGPIGDILVSSDFASTVSVLVVQQYVGPTGVESPRRAHFANTDQRTASAPPYGEREPAAQAFNIGCGR